MKLRKLIALLLTLAMVLPMGLSVVSATETTGEESAVTETTSAAVETTAVTEETEATATETTAATEATESTEESAVGQTVPGEKVWDFSDESQLSDFSLYQSATSAFALTDGALTPDGTDGEMKAIFNAAPETYHSVSVDIIPGESGLINAALYVGASDVSEAVNALNAMGFIIQSDFSGWTDAANRIDIIQGQFNGGWKELSRHISESGNGNNLFSGGTKQALTLKLTFSGDVILLTLSLASNSAKYVQYMYEVDESVLDGNFGLRAYYSDCAFDNLTFYYDEQLPDNTVLWDFNSSDQEEDFTIHEGGGGVSFTGSSLYVAGESNAAHYWRLISLNRTLKNIKSISYDMYSGTTFRNYGGISLFNADGTKFNFSAGGMSTNSGRYNALYVEGTDISAAFVDEDFYNTSAKQRNPINVKLVFEDGTITVTVTNLTTGTVYDRSVALDMADWEGQVGFWVHGSGVYYDNLMIQYEKCVTTTHTYTNTVNSDVADQWTVQDGQGSAEFGSTGLVVAGPNNTAHYWNYVSLNQSFKNIKSVSYDMYSGSTARNFGGITLFNTDGEKFNFSAGGISTNTSRYNALYVQGTGITAAYVNESFYNTSAKKRNPINVTLEFGDGAVTATVTNLTTGTVYTTSTALDMTDWEGQVGFWVHGSKVEYRNLIVVYEETQTHYIAPPSSKLQIPRDETATYENIGTNFSAAGTWKLSGDVASTPYTLEAWVKIPKGVNDSVTGNILGNSMRAPAVAMNLNQGGGLGLVYKIENEDLTVTTLNFDVNTDLRIGQWTHVAYSCDVENDTVIAYINGFEVQRWTGAGLKAVTIPDHVTINNPFQVGASSLLGWVADARLWDSALTAEQINTSMWTQYTEPQEGLLFNAPLDAEVDDAFADLSGYGNSVTTWANAQNLVEQAHEPGAYSIVVIPDQQILSHYSPDVLYNMYQWIADNRETENIQMVLNVGDLADNCGNVTQWENSKAAWELLPEDLPFIAVPGNHDYDTNSGWNKGYGVRSQLTLMSKYFPLSMYESYPTEFGALSRDQGVEDNSGNTWQAFEVNGNKYLVIGLEYIPQEDALEWANEVIATHPNHQVILMTHNNQGANGQISVPNIWNSFTKNHENVIMAVSGHQHSSTIIRRTDKGVNGNDVTHMLIDVQSLDTSLRTGMVAMFRFNADGTQCDVSYYSTRLGQYDANSSFTIELPKQEHKYNALVGTDAYTTVAEAIAASNGGVVKLVQSTDEEITVSSDLTIDLAGYSLSNVTVSEGAKLSLVDSASTYETAGGSAAVTGDVEMLTELDGRKYMVIGEDGVYAAHRYYAGLTHTTLNTANTGFGYKAQYKGDEAVQAQIASIGYQLWIDGGRVVTRSLNGFKNSLTLLLKNFDIEKHGETVVYARIFMTLTNGETVYGATHSSSMRQMVESINTGYESFNESQLTATAILIKKNPVMEDWDVANILATLEPSVTVETITVTDQLMTDVSQNQLTLSLDAALTYTANETAETIAYSDYASWKADFYITIDNAAGEGMYLAGNYGSYGWIAIPLTAGQTYTEVPLAETMLNSGITYGYAVSNLGGFSCGVADTLDNNTGSTVTVELRLTNPDNTEESITLSTETLTIA